MGYWLTSFDGNNLPTNLGASGSHDVGTGSVFAPLVALPSGRNYDPLGTGVANRPNHHTTASVLFVTATAAAMKTLTDLWSAEVGKVGTLVRTGDDASTQTTTARLLDVAIQRHVADALVVPATFTFDLISLPWKGAAHTVIAGSLGTGAHLVTLPNGGNLPQYSVVFRVTAGASSITAVTFTDGPSSYSWSYSGTITAGHILTVDTGKLSVQNNGADDYAHFTPPSTHEAWEQLQQGPGNVPAQSTISLTTAGADNQFDATYNDAWA